MQGRRAKTDKDVLVDVTNWAPQNERGTSHSDTQSLVLVTAFIIHLSHCHSRALSLHMHVLKTQKEDVMLFIVVNCSRNCVATLRQSTTLGCFFATSNCFDSDKSSLSETLTLAEGLVIRHSGFL